MSCYFSDNFRIIASVISDEYKVVFQKSMKTKSEYEAVVVLAQDREQWRKKVQSVTQKYCESRKEKVTKQRKVRRKAEAKREEKK